MRSSSPALWPALAAALLCAACGTRQPAVPADTIYFGGDIVTVNDAQPTAEALAVKDGKILAVGTRAEVEKAHRGGSTQEVDLGGRTMTPGFVDGHTHFMGLGPQAIGANLLAPPDGDVNTIDDIVAKLKEFAAGPDAQATGWIFGLGYDDALLGRHPTRDDLDRVSLDIPVMAAHISGHFSAVNSAALRKMGYTAATKDPVGGRIRRRPGSREPIGTNEEAAHFAYGFGAINPTTPEGKDYFAKRALEMAKSFGYTTINEGRAFRQNHLDFLEQSGRGLFDIDVLSYIDYIDRDLIEGAFSKQYRNHYRVAGEKITMDGSPQGRTAWRTVPYLIPPEGQKATYRGYPAITDDMMLAGLFDEAYKKGWPVHAHANGDASIDQMIRAIAPAEAKYGAGDRRMTLIHGQFVRLDQLDSLKKYQIIPSLFPMHTFYWGDWYGQIIGPEAAQRISPMQSAIRLGLMPTSHTDAPVALPNLMQVMWATVNRTSRSGKVIGPDERTTPLDALKSITLWGAREHFEEGTKGSLEVGKLADLVILSDNPLTIDPMQINGIQVLETIKEGRSVWKRNAAPITK